MLFGIVLSGVLIIASQISDDAQREVERRDLIEQVTRGQYPLRDVRLSYSLDVANAHPDLAPFVKRFKEGVATARAVHIGGQRIVPGVARWLSFGNEEASQASVCPGSHLFPNIQSEAVAYAAYSNAQVTLQIYRTPIAIHEYPFHDAMNRQTFSRLKKPDLVMTFGNDLSRDSSLCIEYDFKNQQLALDGIDLTTNPDDWKASGKIISLLDLRGSQMFVDVAPAVAVVGTERVRIPHTLRHLRLRSGVFEGLWIFDHDVRTHVGVDGLPFYEYRFPVELEPILHSPNSISVVTTSP
jgi:hypothetical protein